MRRKKVDGEERYSGAVPISSLFEKYKKKLRPPQGIVISTFCTIVASELGITLTPSTIRYSVYSRTLSITTFGPQKSEILLRRAHILALCRESLGDLGTPEHIV